MDNLYERRRFTRWPFSEPVQIRLSGCHEQYGTLASDIGLGGVSVLSARFLPKSTKVTVQSEKAGSVQEGFWGAAKVAWTQKVSYAGHQYRAGLEFTELTGGSRQWIEKYISKWVWILCIGLIWSFVSTSSCFGYWEWTPETGRWINPKHAAKNTPQEQYAYAVNFYEAKEYKKAVREFSKLVKSYPHSEYAPKGQIGLGESYEKMGEYYRAFQSYQKLIETYPSYPDHGEIIERQYRIGNLFFEGQKRKLLGFEILPSGEQAVEIFKRVVENAPYGSRGEEAQYKIGECYKKLKKYDEATKAFEFLMQQYPNGKFTEAAHFQIALCTVKESKESQYDQETTDQAIGEFHDFLRGHPEDETALEAREMIRELEDRKAEKSYQIAKFYESRGDVQSAKIYYQEILTQYPESSYATTAREKLEKLLN